MKIDINNLKTNINMRVRAGEDVSTLMESIKEQGLLQPIVARAEDYEVICGNRRLMACKKLGLKDIEVILKENISDKELILLNLTENIQRRSVSSIEIGKQCETLVQNKNMNQSEIAVALGITVGRVNTCLMAYRRTPEEFVKDISYGAMTEKTRGIPENVLVGIVELNKIRKLTNTEFNFLLTYARDEKLNRLEIKVIGQILRESNMSVQEAVEDLDNYDFLWACVLLDKKEMIKSMKFENTSTKQDFMRKVFEKYNKKLITLH